LKSLIISGRNSTPHLVSGLWKGIILRDFAIALERLDYPRDEVVIVSGFGVPPGCRLYEF
jgi:hypothetical protein